MLGKERSKNQAIQEIRDLKTRRVRKRLTPGNVEIHQAAESAFVAWQDLRRQFHPGSLVRPEIAPALLGHIPVQGVRTRERWQIFSGFETYSSIQSLTDPQESVRTEITHYTNIPYRLIEPLSLALLLQNIESYSLCGSVAEEQIRRRLKASFSQQALDSVLACDPTSQDRYAESLRINVSRLKRQANRLKPAIEADPDFISNIQEGLRRETTN